MPTIEEINSHLAQVVDNGFQHFNQELNSFHSNPATDQAAIEMFLNRVGQYQMLFWGYECVTKGLGTASANQIDQVVRMRAMVDGARQQTQDLLNHCYQAQKNYQMPVGGQNAVEDFQSRQFIANAELIAKRQQMFNYQNRLWELTQQGGMPLIQAQVIAKQDTGYTG
jgi:hypothetical protein